MDLKISEFTHSDAGQMNMYLNYYKENEEHTGDDSPIGIILCSGKNEPLVKYTIMSLPQQLFFSRYLINLPSEKKLKTIIENEKGKLIWYLDTRFIISLHHCSVTTNWIIKQTKNYPKINSQNCKFFVKFRWLMLLLVPPYIFLALK